ncbi:NUDIX domain-containing protein [Pseudomonadota bacterium]
MDHGEVQVVKCSTCFEGFFRIDKYRLRHSLFQGGMSDEMSRELFERGGAVAVLPYDPVLDRVVLIEQFRIGAIRDKNGAWLTEIVAGMIADGEMPEDVARRESIEESGCEIGELLPICTYYPSPGACSETIALYCGKVDARDVSGIHGLDHENEDIRVFTAGFEEALTWIDSGRINSAAPIMALQWLEINKAKVVAAWK